MRWLALQELAVAKLADELTVADLDFAADGNFGRPAFEFPAFERAVVDVHLLSLGRDFAAIVGVVDDKIGVVAERDRAFAGEEAEEFCRLRAAGVDEGVDVDA